MSGVSPGHRRTLDLVLSLALGLGALAFHDDTAAGASTGITFRSATSAHNTVAASLMLSVPPVRAAGDVMIATVDVMQAPIITARSAGSR